MDDPQLNAARQAVSHILHAHEPCPAVAFDRHWHMLMANRMVAPLLQGIAAVTLLTPPINLLRVSLHPGGLAPRIVNLVQWRQHLFQRLSQQIQTTGDTHLTELLQELQAYPVPHGAGDIQLAHEHPGVLMPFLLDTPLGRLHLISTTTVFGSPSDITLQELALETFFPGDAPSAHILHTLSEQVASATSPGSTLS